MIKPKEVVLAISDIQAPFQHADTLSFLEELKVRYKPTQIVCMGDEEDQHGLSEYDKDPDGFSAGHEHEKALEFLQKLYRLFPRVRVCTSNHTDRVFRKAMKHGIPKAYLKSYSEFLKAPSGWEWREDWEVDGVLYEHGEGFSGQNGALDAAKANMQSTVIGHLHSWAGIKYLANKRHLIFGFNTGCLIDAKAYAFAYGRKHKNKPIIGTGLIIRGIPTFVPMQLDKHGRWTGKL